MRRALQTLQETALAMEDAAHAGPAIIFCLAAKRGAKSHQKEQEPGEVPMERYDPAISRCPFMLLCGASASALLVFVGALHVLG